MFYLRSIGESMPALSEKLILMALAALSEIADQCGKTRAPKSLTLRFLLAYTYVAAGAKPQHKWLWSDFWQNATAPKKGNHEAYIDDYCRHRDARIALTGICRQIGYEPDTDFEKMLRSARNTSSRNESKPSPDLMPANDDPGDDAA